MPNILECGRDGDSAQFAHDASTVAAGTTVDELITALRDKSAEIRRSATETLRELEDA